MLSKRVNWQTLALAALAAGAALRIAGLGAAALWYDESYTLALTRFDPVTMVRLAAQDFNPPGWELIAWPFTRLIPGLYHARIPALLASLAGLVLVWLITGRLIQQPPARFAAVALAALLPVGFWTAQDGRCYALLSTLYLAGLWFILNRRWLGLAAVTGLILYMHNTGLFYAAALGLSGLAACGDNKITWSTIKCHQGLIYAMAAGVLSYLPWVPALIQSTSGDFWLGPLTWGGLNYAMIQAAFTGTLGPVMAAVAVYGIWFALAAAVLLVGGGWLADRIQPATAKVGNLVLNYLRMPTVTVQADPAERGQLVLMVFALGPLVLLDLASMTYKNLIFYRPLVPAVVPVCLFLAAALTPRRLTLTTWLLPYTAAVLVLAGLIGWDPDRRGGDLDQAAEFITQHAQPGDIVYHATATSLMPFGDYLNLNQYLLDEQQPDGLLRWSLQDAFDIQRAPLEDLHSGGRVWFVWARDPIVTDQAARRMAGYTQGAVLVGRVQSWQFAPMEIYLQGEVKP